MQRNPNDITASSLLRPFRCCVRVVWRCAHFTLVAIVIGLLVGCSRTPNFAVTRVQGSVSIDGKPIADGRIQFLPKERDQGQVTESAISNGRYVATAVPLGKVSVMFYATRQTGEMIRDHGTPYPEVVTLIPPKYREGIELEILGETLDQNFELKSK